MITPVRYFWQQFNGPQISCVLKAVFEWLKSVFDSTLDYFNDWTTDTVNDKHLTTIGTLMGIGRPVIKRVESTKFFFTATIHGEGGHNNIHGFSEIGGQVGGRFGEVEDTGGQIEVLQENYYRAVLKAIQTSTGEEGSLILLEDIANALNNVNNSPIFTTYNFHWYREPEGRNGDVLLYMGNVTDWDRSTYVIAALQAVTRALYGPEPLLSTEMAPT